MIYTKYSPHMQKINEIMQNLSFKAQVTDWFTQKPALTRIFDALTQAGYAPRFVGGCVRDVLFASMGRTYAGGDFDIAVPCPPEITTEILQSAGIKVIPTGIDFGSITAVLNGEHYEITSLRCDVETDGRRAVVSYTTDWAVDAHRRDFTINALSMDKNGILYDYCDGIADAQAGIVRFVGDADIRVQEDILRILRYYRFYMLYGNQQEGTMTEDTPQKEAWHACQTHAQNIDQLSRERIWGEMMRILSEPDSSKLSCCLSLMQCHGVLAMVLPEHRFDKDNFATLYQSINTISGMDSIPKNMRAMMALVVLHKGTEGGTQTPRDICLKRLCTSKGENHIWDILHKSLDGNDTVALYNSLDSYGRIYTHVRLILGGSTITPPIIKAIHDFNPTPFPLSGQDIMDLGIPSGAEIGVLLKQAKTHWYQSKCTLGKEQLLSHIR